MKTRTRILLGAAIAISAIILSGLRSRARDKDSCVPTPAEVDAIRQWNPSMTPEQAADVARYSCEFAVRP